VDQRTRDSLCSQRSHLVYRWVQDAGGSQGQRLWAILIIIYLFTAVGLLPGGSAYFTCKQNKKLVTTKLKSGGLQEKHVVATWNFGNHLSICL